MSKTKKYLLGILVLVALAVLIAAGVQRWKRNVIAQQDLQAKSHLKSLIENGQFETAWEALKRVPHLSQDSEWQSLRVQALVGTKNLTDLNQVFQTAPDSILANERASLLLARSFSHQGENDSFAQVQDHWSKQAHETNLWLSLDIDRKLLAGDIPAAWDQLSGIATNNTLSANLLIQRALIRAGTNTVAALEDLDRAFEADSRSPELRSFRGQVLERLGDKQLARIEYIAAHLAAPDNILWRDQLAEFYRRHQQFDFALSTWRDVQNTNSTDYVYLKSHFWTRVTTGVTLTNNSSLPNGPLMPLATLIQDLPKGTFWDESAFLSLANQEAFRSKRQEVYWLSLLQHLKEGDEAAAAEQLSERPFRQGLWDVYLHETLASIIRFRSSGRFSPNAESPASRLNITPNQHVLVSLIKQFQREEIVDGKTPDLSANLEALLKGPNAFTAAFLAAGWRQTALDFFHSRQDEDLANYPSWFHYGIGQTMRYNASPENALTYLQSQAQTEDIQLLSAELLLGTQQRDEAMKQLSVLATSKSPEGARAAWLVAIDHLQQKRLEIATAFISGNPNLTDSLRGNELRAKAAELAGDLNSAAALYQTIVDDSAVAKRFLADQAFRSQDLQTARRHTLALLNENPADLKIMANLRAIDAAIESNQ